MKNSLLGAALIIGFAASTAHAGVINCNILVDGTSIATCPTTSSGSLIFAAPSGASPLFSSISLTADGPPTLPNPDLSTVTLDVSASSGFTGTHILTVDIFQTGVSAPAGTTLETTATINNLIGLPGPTTLSDFFNGTSSSLGTTLRSNIFPVSFTGAIGPFVDVIPTALTADAESYAITFSAANQSANDTIQLQGVTQSVYEPNSLAMLGTALLGFGWIARRRRG